MGRTKFFFQFLLNKFLGGNGYDTVHFSRRWRKARRRGMQFKEPRFVYEDGFESTELFKLFRHGRIVGYRISPQLVIHTDVVTNCLKHNVDDMCDYCGGFLLDSRSIHTLRKNWNAVSLMRQLIGDKPLPEPYFWYMAENGDIASTHYQQDVDEENPVISNLILRL